MDRAPLPSVWRAEEAAEVGCRVEITLQVLVGVPYTALFHPGPLQRKCLICKGMFRVARKLQKMLVRALM